jgi:hypothetical protein
VVHRALAVGRLHFADLDPSRTHNRDLQRFVGLLVADLGRTVLAEQWSFVDEGAAYTAHLSGPVAFHLVFRREGAHLEMVFVTTDPALLARTRLSALEYFTVEARMMHVMRGHGIVSQIVEHGGERSR